jgi:pimeloyl-ACP methyl ester carboxylesterase
MPVLLVRGRESELVGEDEVEAFVAAVPHARFADIAGARHMVAGDKNDVFTQALLTFFESLTWR